jgi:two-component system sensor histidine kinase AlgZ
MCSIVGQTSRLRQKLKKLNRWAVLSIQRQKIHSTNHYNQYVKLHLHLLPIVIMQSVVQRNRVFLMHLSFWCVYFSFLFYQISWFQKGDFDWPHVILVTAIQTGFAMIVSYLNYFIFLPRFLESKNIWRYLLEFLIPFALVMFIRLHLERYLIDGYSHEAKYLYKTRFIIQVIITNFFIVIFVSMLRFAIDWFEFETKQKAVENEKLSAELNFLKAQINPHFLFNTLNNLYYLAYSQSPNTTEVIDKLSQMMRYMIYDSNHDKVPLSKEIEYMQNYIRLERLRLNNEVPINFEIKGNTDKGLITPLIFITFLENAFKHGLQSSYANAWVNISIEIKDKECIYKVSNSKPSGMKLVKDDKHGIGLQNVKRRLELSYPGKFQLTSKDEIDRYSMQLNITLA